MDKRGLGRGLSSLVGGFVAEDPSARVLQIPVSDITPNQRQPRQEWDDGSLEELAESIRVHGVLQPLLVRGHAGAYELVAGERRLRASRLAGLSVVPAIIRDTDDEGSLELALIENIQREDISALDAARAYQQLIDEFKMTQEEIARAVGKSRPAVANALRLLKLPNPILESLRAREITEGHARALLAVENPAEQQRLFNLSRRGASVREIEDAARAEDHPAKRTASSPLHTTTHRPMRLDPHIEAIVDQIRDTLGLRVEIRGDSNKGILSLEYYSSDDLEDLVSRLIG